MMQLQWSDLNKKQNEADGHTVIANGCFPTAQKRSVVQHVWRWLPLCSSTTYCIPWWNSIYVTLHDKWLCLLLSKCSVTLMYGFIWWAACDSRIAWVNEYVLWSEQTHHFCYKCWSCMADVCLSFLLSFFLPPSLLQAFCKANYFSAHIDLDCFSISLVDAFSYPLNPVWVQGFIHLQNRKGKIKIASVSCHCVMPFCMLLQSYHVYNDQSHRQVLQLIHKREIMVCYPI